MQFKFKSKLEIMSTLKTKASSQEKFVNEYEIINHLYQYGINVENIEFVVVENHCEAYGVGQYQILELPEAFYNENIEAIENYLK